MRQPKLPDERKLRPDNLNFFLVVLENFNIGIYLSLSNFFDFLLLCSENSWTFITVVTDAVTEFIEGLVETYPGLQYLDGFPEVISIWFDSSMLHAVICFMCICGNIFLKEKKKWKSRLRLCCVLMFHAPLMTKLQLYQVRDPIKFQFM